jgi:hypothetical protein
MRSAYPGEALLFRFFENRFSVSTEIGPRSGCPVQEVRSRAVATERLSATWCRHRLRLSPTFAARVDADACFTAVGTGTTQA